MQVQYVMRQVRPANDNGGIVPPWLQDLPHILPIDGPTTPAAAATSGCLVVESGQARSGQALLN